MRAWKNAGIEAAIKFGLLGLIMTFATVLNAAYLPDSKAYPTSEDSTVWYDKSRRRNVPVKIYAPDPAVAKGRLPVVVFSPGFGESRESYAYLGQYLAHHGYITMVVDHIGSDTDAFNTMGWKALADPESFLKRPRDLSFVIDQITASDQANPLLSNRVDSSRIGVAGHSMGSTTALALAGLSIDTQGLKGPVFLDKRVRATVVMSPQVDSTSSLSNKKSILDSHSWDSVNGPVLLMTGSRDYGVTRATRTDPGARRVVFERLKAGDIYFMNIDNAAHHAFTDTKPYYPGGPRDPRHHGWINMAVTAFFDAYLRDDKEALEWLQNKTITKVSGGEVKEEFKAGTSKAIHAGAIDNGDSGYPQYDFSSLTAFIERGLRDQGVPGAGMLIIDRSGHVYYEKYFGTWSEDKAVPIASASKWWAAATLMTLVDKGLISLDDKVAKYLPEFRDKGSKSNITVRQTLAFTTGYIHHIAMQDDPSITQAELVQFIADMDLKEEPGTAFIYGGLQMEIAGRIAEVVTGKPYRQVFEEQILQPLGADATKIGNMVNRRPNNMDFKSANPLVPGGVVTNMVDYKKFILMLLNNGVYNNVRILSKNAIHEMMKDQTNGVPILRTAQEDHSFRYSLGAWHRVVDKASNEVIVSSRGAFGTSPWINLKGGYGVVFITMARAEQMREFIWRLMDNVTDIMNGRQPVAQLPKSTGASARQASGAGGLDNFIKKLDKNNDGALARDEIPKQMVRLNKAFEKLDRDHNGRLSPKELSVVPGFSSDQSRPVGKAEGDRVTRTVGGTSVTPSATPLDDDIYQSVESGLTIAVNEQLILRDDRRGKDVQLRITYPRSGGPYPLIIFSHYSGGTKDDYAPLISYWASHGYVCIQPDHSDSPAVGGKRGVEARSDWRNRPLDISFIIDSLPEISQRIPELRGKIDAKNIGVGGHYLGAYTANLIGGMKPPSAIDSSEQLKDSRVKAIVALSPQGTGQGVTKDSWRAFNVPMLVMTGSKDLSTRTSNSAQWRTEPYLYSPAGDKYLVYVEGLTSEYGGIVTQAGKGGVVSRDEAHLAYTRISTLAFWDAYLKNSQSAGKFLRSDDLETGSGGAIDLSWK
jgi:predicted dienelactone hydrolase/CubicO group peptidase (beta-lactamase class C family)